MNDIPQAEGNIWSFLVFAVIVLGFIGFKFKDKIIAKYKEYKEKCSKIDSLIPPYSYLLFKNPLS